MSRRPRTARVAGLLVALAAWALALAPAGAAAAPIRFSTPSIIDPIHTFGEPDVGIDALGRVFASGPTGTGTQRSVWFGSPDGGHSFRTISPGPMPSALAGTEAPPGGGDTDIAFDTRGKQYFADLAALTCLRTAVTPDGGATASESVFPAGCGGVPGADRQWLAVYDPPAGTPNQSAYTGPKPLIYLEYNNLVSGAQWVMSNSANDPQPGGPGLNYSNAEQGGPSNPNYAPWGADGYPAIDQVSGKVLQAASTADPDGKPNDFDLLLNIGTPDSTGALSFLDAPAAPGGPGDQTKLIHIADHIKGDTSVLFDVVSMDQARNLYAVWTVTADAKTPANRQVWVSAASAASGWTKWSAPVQVSDGSAATGDAVNIMPWIQAGGPGRADAVWYGANKVADPSTPASQAWNVFMAQLAYPTAAHGGVSSGRPDVQLVKVSPHAMKYNDVCLVGTNCITQQGNRNLADFFQVKTDATGAAEVIYDDTSNGLVQPGFTPGNQQVVDHAGAGVVTLARQSSGPGLFGSEVSGPSDDPQSGLTKPPGDAKYPVIGGTEVPGLDVLGTRMSLAGETLHIVTQVIDLAHPATTVSAVAGASLLQYVTRWEMGNTLYYASMEEDGSGGAPTFFAGASGSVDLCSVSACFPHVLTYPEAGGGGTAEKGSVSCPPTPSVATPCTLTIDVKAADVGRPSTGSLLEEVGTYALTESHQQSQTTNAQAQADNVPLEIDGLCCFNFRSSGGSGPSELSAQHLASLLAAARRRNAVACASRRNFSIRLPRGLTSATVFVNGRKVRVVRGRRLRAPVHLTGLPKGRFTVRIVGHLRRGGRQVTIRRYRTCTPKRRHRYVPPHTKHARRH